MGGEDKMDVESAIRDNPHFSILGVDGDMVRVTVKGQPFEVMEVRRARLLKRRTLLALAAMDWWMGLAQSKWSVLTPGDARKVGAVLLKVVDEVLQVDAEVERGRSTGTETR